MGHVWERVCRAAETTATGHDTERPRGRSGRARAGVTVGAAGDSLEREADRVADEVIGRLRGGDGWTPDGIAPIVGGEGRIRRRESRQSVGEAGGALDPDTERSIAAARSTGGRPLAGGVRQPMEVAFAADFGDVRVHTGAESAALTEQLGASAFTLRRDIFFNGPIPSADEPDGQHLLAHELAHTVQQGASRVARSGVVVTSGESRIQRGRGKKKRAQATGGTAPVETTTPDEREDDIGEDVEESSGEDVSVDEPVAPQQAQVAPSPGIVWGMVGAVTGMLGSFWQAAPPTPTVPATVAPTPPTIEQAARERKRAEDEQASQAAAKRAAEKQRAEDEARLKAEMQKTAADANRQKQIAEAVARKKQAEAEAAAKVLRTQKQQEKEVRKKKAEADKLAKQIAHAQADVDQRADGVVANAEQALKDAKARGVSAGNLRNLVNQLGAQRGANKPDPLKVQVTMNDVDAGTAKLKVEISDADVAAQKQYATESATVLPAAKDAATRGAANRIDVAKLNGLVNQHEKWLLEVPPLYQRLLASLQKIKQVSDSIDYQDAKAVKYTATSAAVLADGTTAKAEGEQALTSDPTHPRDSDFWSHLRKALAELDSLSSGHDALLAAEQPDWPALTKRLTAIKDCCQWIRREIGVAPARPEGRVPRSRYSPAIEKMDPDIINGDGEADEYDALKETLDAIDGVDNGWSGGVGGKWGAHHGSFEGNLPEGSYSEYYVRPPEEVKSHGWRRVVVGDDGRRWYSWTHYGERGDPAFVLLMS